MAKPDKRIDLDGSFIILFLQNPAAFWKGCMEDIPGLFLKPYQNAYRPRLFGKKQQQYTTADFSAVRRQSTSGEELIVVFLPQPEEPAPFMYHMAYGISCINQGGVPRDIRMHFLQYSQLSSPSIIRVEQQTQTMVLFTTKDRPHQMDMLWRAAFGNRVDPSMDTELFFTPSGQPQTKHHFMPSCQKMAEYTEGGHCWAGPAPQAHNIRSGDTVNLNDPPRYQAQEIDLSNFAATTDLFGSGLSPAEEQRRKMELAARHKCRPEDIHLGRTPYGGTYSISRGSNGHYSHEEYDDHHKLVWFESITASPHR